MIEILLFISFIWVIINCIIEFENRRVYAESVIKKYDINIDSKTKLLDNELDFEEFKNYVKKENIISNDDNVIKVFNSIDKNKSNKIDLNEIKNYSIVTFLDNTMKLSGAIFFIFFFLFESIL